MRPLSFLMAEQVEIPEQQVAETPKETIPEKAPRKINRAEKKMREALLKHNLKQLENVTTVTMMKGRQMVWTFTQPDVYYIDNVYIVFGESQMQDAGRRAVDELKDTVATEETPVEAKPEIKEEDVKVDETGLEENDINLVMTQANCSRSRAVGALREANGDIVTAVMNLTI